MTQQNRVFRLITEMDCEEAKKTDRIPLVPVDREDGYVHLSPKGQVLNTAGLYFAPGSALHVLEFDAVVFGSDLKWEWVPEREDDFPHLYNLDLRWHQACFLHTINWSTEGEPAWGNRRPINTAK
ncbi:MAG: DUF952 domain-containing protein [Myxococcota bacterium]|nr:DUF952 domain-containing protein [Myxococcota bacterium]